MTSRNLPLRLTQWVAVLIGGFLLGCSTATDIPDIELVTITQGLTSPVALVSPLGDKRRFVVDRTGFIHILNNDGTVVEEPFLDISDRLVDFRASFDERGLLGLAFHPDYRNNGRYFVYYSAPLRDEGPPGWDHTSTVSEFRANAPVSGGQASTTQADSERVVLHIDQPQFNHNGGALSFGPDGYLYIALGDGGGANDVGNGHPGPGNGQTTTTLLGSILRIDIDNGEAGYGIPTDNPFAGRKSGRDEIHSWGWRNPWRMSFDRVTGELWVATNGQELWEAVYEASAPGNYGWNRFEGSHCFDPRNPGTSLPDDACSRQGPHGYDIRMPVVEYPHPGNQGDHTVAGISVIGGYVYRGDAIPELAGRYVFGDWARGFARPEGQLFIASPTEPGRPWDIARVRVLDDYLLGFGEDSEGELYLLTSSTSGPTGSTGAVHKIVPKRQPHQSQSSP